MRANFLLIIIIAAGLAGCATVPPSDRQPIQAITCKSKADCDVKWSKAVAWVSANAAYRMQVQSEQLIQTYNSIDTGLSVVVNKISEPNGAGKIVARMSCGNMFGCFPDTYVALQQFTAFVGR